MNQLFSFSLLVGAGSFAFIINEIIKYFQRCRFNYNLKKQSRSEIYKKKCERLHDNAFSYYYSLATTRPELLSYDLASRDINRLKNENLINDMYSKMRAQK